MSIYEDVAGNLTRALMTILADLKKNDPEAYRRYKRIIVAEGLDMSAFRSDGILEPTERVPLLILNNQN